MSVESTAGQKADFSYYATFKPDDIYPNLNIKSHTQAISLPFEKDDLKLVRFYSNSSSVDTFHVYIIRFLPIYLGSFDARLFSKTFYPAENYVPMTHNKWYTFDKI